MDGQNSEMKDPSIQKVFRGHKDTISSCVFNPNMYVISFMAYFIKETSNYWKY